MLTHVVSDLSKAAVTTACVVDAGQAVFGQASGSLGSHVKSSQTNLVAMPANVTFEAAATLPTVFITADAAFCRATSLHASDRVLVHAAAGKMILTLQHRACEWYCPGSVKTVKYLICFSAHVEVCVCMANLVLPKQGVQVVCCIV